MHQDTVPERLTLLVVTEDRALQRQVSRFLDKVGYHVLQAAEPHSAVAALQSHLPTIVLLGSDLGARDNWELLARLADRQASPERFAFLMVEEPDDEVVREAFETGADDILLLPLDYGELLSRLRAAARISEYDRRANRQNRVDPLTGLLGRPALTAEARRELAERVRSSSPRVACVALDIDSLQRINRQHGWDGGDLLLKAVAQELSKMRSGAEIVGCLKGGRFAAILPGASDTTAVEWAEHARRVLAADRFKLGEATVEVTASFGVAGCDAGESAEKLIDRACEALDIAKTSGRNCVVRYGEFAADDSHWGGQLFERTVARDVMTPCSVLLRSDEPLREAVALFERTQLDGIPVVDAHGVLVGLCEQHLLEEARASGQPGRVVRDFMSTDVQSFGEQEMLLALLEFFTRDSRSMAVVVRNDQPVGVVACSSLAAMSQQVTLDSFASATPYCDTSDYLLVPDNCALASDQTT